MPVCVHVHVLALCTAAAAAAVANGAFTNSYVYVVNVHPDVRAEEPQPNPEPQPEVARDDENATAQTSSKVMAASDGRLFRCSVPLPGAAAAESKLRQLKHTNAKIDAAAAVVATLSCVSFSHGQWSYEVCPGSLRQFAAGDPAGGLLFAASTDDDRLGTLPDGRVAFVQRFVSEDGDNPRVATVRFECVDHSVAGLQRQLPRSASHGIVAVTSNPLKEDVVDVLIHARQLCDVLPSSTALLRSLNGKCFLVPQGFWSVELCVGDRVRQFHLGGDNADVVEQEHSLGRCFSDAIDTDPARPPAIVQRYTDGTLCKDAGFNRETFVRFQCSHEAGAPVVLAVKEPRTCVYEVTIATEEVCAHPLLTPPAEEAGSGPELTIDCVPMLAAAA